MKKSIILLSLAAATLSFSSCQKELDELAPASTETAAAPTTQSKAELLSAAAWHLTGLTSATVASAGSEAATVSLLDRLKPWVRDNAFSYATGGAYTQDEGLLKVHPAAPQVLTGTWQLSPAGDSLTVTQGPDVRRYGVAELTATTLRLTRAEAGVNGQPGAVFTNVYAH